MIASKTPLLLRAKKDLLSSGRGDQGGTKPDSPAGAPGSATGGGDVAVMPELKWDGDTSVCAALKATALAPQSGQKRAPSGNSRAQLEQAVKGRFAMTRRYKSRGARGRLLGVRRLENETVEDLAEVPLLLLRLLVELFPP